MDQLLNNQAKWDALVAKSWGIVDLINNYDLKLGLEQFLSVCDRLSPRLYTISSSAVASPDVVSMTISLSAIPISPHEARYGLVSGFVLDCKAKLDSKQRAPIRFGFQVSNFELPKDDGTEVLFIANLVNCSCNRNRIRSFQRFCSGENTPHH
jgi:sulfite reductase alpha subunit-like flavoprotein